MSVPARFAGRKFVLLLEGSARIDDPKVLSGGHVKSRSASCRYGLKGTGPTGPCQLLSGTISKQHPVIVPGNSCLDEEYLYGMTDYAHVIVDIGGYSHIRTSATWAYQAYTLPGLAGDSFDDYLSSWNGIPLNGWYRTGNATGCRNDILPASSTLTSVYQPATHNQDQTALSSARL